MVSPYIKIFLFAIFISSVSQSQLKFDLILDVNKKLPQYGFTVETKESDSLFTHYIIKIYQAESNKFIQSIDMDNYDIIYSEYEFPDIDSLIDVNFDGYKDLCVAAGSGQNGKNQLFHIFLFDKLKEEFYKELSFDTIYNFYVDDSLKCIYESFWNGACTDECVVWNTYKVLSNKLTLAESDYTEYDSETDTVRRYIEIYEDGKLISKKEVGLDGDNK